jgi:hypothetical protein
MSVIDYRETELWEHAKALLVETYRLTLAFPPEGKDLANDIRGNVRYLVRVVPNAFKKGGISGNMHLDMAKGQVAELEGLCECAEVLGFAPPGSLSTLVERAAPIRQKFRELSQEARQHANELMRKRSSMDNYFGDEGDDF